MPWMRQIPTEFWIQWGGYYSVARSTGRFPDETRIPGLSVVGLRGSPSNHPTFTFKCRSFMSSPSRVLEQWFRIGRYIDPADGRGRAVVVLTAGLRPQRVPRGRWFEPSWSVIGACPPHFCGEGRCSVWSTSHTRVDRVRGPRVQTTHPLTTTVQRLTRNSVAYPTDTLPRSGPLVLRQVVAVVCARALRGGGGAGSDVAGPLWGGRPVNAG